MTKSYQTVNQRFVRKNKIFSFDPVRKHRASKRRMLLIMEWGRDSDITESVVVYAIPAGRRYLTALYREVQKNAEGPFSLSVLSPEEYREVSPWTRDRALEAFEDGHEWVIF